MARRFILSDLSFAELGVNPSIIATLAAAGIVAPFPIQELAIPIALRGTDLIGQAKTGTGKTLAFGIPLLQRINLPATTIAPQALVMCPTRELALQVSQDVANAGQSLAVRLVTVYGGVGYDPQLEALHRGVDVVVGTPGRLLDLKRRHELDLSQVSILVLDEADEMLDLGFLPDVEKLVAAVPRARQTMLFSATMPSAILALARAQLNQPINIRAEVNSVAETVPETTQFVYQAHDLDKPSIVGKLLQSPTADKVMVFCTTKREVQRVADDLSERGFTVTSLHGDLSQAVREKSLNRFRAGRAQAIICTDVAARGIDIDLVSHVVNYDCPDSELTYVHRIGRTGRAGRSGIAVTLVDWADIPRWKAINRALHLPFDDPAESYSTTPELLADLAIPAEASGRLVTPGSNRPPRETSDRTGPPPSHHRPGRRTRRSHGVVVHTRSGAPESAEASGQAGEAAADATAPASGRSPGRSRRRRRSATS